MKTAPCSDCLALEANRSFPHKKLKPATVPLGVFHAEVDPTSLHLGWRCPDCGRLWKYRFDTYVDGPVQG